MLNRFFAFLLIIGFLGSAPVGASTNAETLRAAMDDFNFAVNVEWDQKDQAFYDAQIVRFQEALNVLSAQGMTQKEMLTEAQALVKDSRTAAELQKTLQLIEANNLSSTETKKLVMEMIAQSQSRGANWSGDFAYAVGPLVALVLVIALVVGASGGSSCGGEGQPECPVNTCSYGYHYQCFNYYDQFGMYRFMSGCDFVWSCF